MRVTPVTCWPDNPAPVLEEVFTAIAHGPMRDVPICNPALRVEAHGFRQREDGHWVGVMITPWAINLLCLPGRTEGWPPLPACAKHDWQFPSGNYEFTVAEEARLGVYHLCSLFSPALDLPSHEQAQLTARATLSALFAAPIAEPATTDAATAATIDSNTPPSRRAFLGLGRRDPTRS